MKYSEYRSQSKFKGSAAFYIIIAFCLIAIGGAAWFAAASINKRDLPKTDSSEIPNSSYYSTPESDIKSYPPAVTPSEEAGKAVSDEPYSSEQTATESKEEDSYSVIFSMPVGGETIKDYSVKQLQYSATYGDMRIHTGIDIACEDGTSVSAAGHGKVTAVEESSSLGNTVTIDHGNGITTKYAALKNIKVKEGDKVTAGDIIGSVTTVPGECADQSHLHFEVFKNGHSAPPLSTLGLN